MPTESASLTSLLLTHGDCSQEKPQAAWPDYPALGLTSAHVPELIALATSQEPSLADIDDDESLECRLPVHAWRALGQLKAVEAVAPLAALYFRDEDDDWVLQELPMVFELIGPAAIPALAEAFAGHADKVNGCMGLAESIRRIGQTHPDARADCVTCLTELFAKFETYAPELNGSLVWNLCDIQAVEALPLIRAAFEREYVDYSIMGDIEQVEMVMGVRTTRATPEDFPSVRDQFPGLGERLDQLGDGTTRKTKVGRNDPCPCGSGKKYKKCCLNHPVDTVHEEFLAMFSTQKIRIAQSRKEALFDLIRRKQQAEAMAFVQTLTSADPRLIADYVKRQEFPALSAQNRKS